MSRRIIVGIVLLVILLVGLAWSVGYSAGNEQGWRGCIEENNLYERYYYENN